MRIGNMVVSFEGTKKLSLDYFDRTIDISNINLLMIKREINGSRKNTSSPAGMSSGMHVADNGATRVS